PIDRVVFDKPQYILDSSYAYQIDQYLEHFDRDRLLVVTSDDLRDRRRETMMRVFSFVGVDTSWDAVDLDEEAHRTADKVVARPTQRRLLQMRRYRALAERAPRPMRRLGRRVAYRTVADVGPERLRLSPRSEARLRDALRE